MIYIGGLKHSSPLDGKVDLTCLTQDNIELMQRRFDNNYDEKRGFDLTNYEPKPDYFKHQDKIINTMLSDFLCSRMIKDVSIFDFTI